MALWRNFVKEEENEVIISQSDKRTYRVLQLTNGLRICLISDPNTEMATAAMDVYVGDMSNPDDIPGLAHFCEHMLFMGTKKYPAENDFRKFVSEHGGKTNATTSTHNTNYHFDVNAEYLMEALDRFAQFFIAPLFTESAIEREVNAVHSENEHFAMSDDERIIQVEKATMNPNHPYCKFGVGNRETLLDIPKARGQNIRDELLKFYKTYYSSNIMAFAVLGKESLDELAEMTVPLFALVENNNIQFPIWKENPIRKEDTQLQINAVPILHYDSLGITWPVKEYMSNSIEYLNHLLEHNGPGSLSSELKSRHWISDLKVYYTGPFGFKLLDITFQLNQDGIEHTDEIITMVFQYINMICKDGVKKWVWDEIAQMSKIEFSFSDEVKPQPYTQKVASALNDLSIVPNATAKTILSGSFFLDDFEQNHINQMLEEMTPRSMRVTVVAQKFEGSTDHVEKWYGTPYSINAIPEITLQKWEQAGFNEKFHLPEQNEFIPSNFDLQSQPENPSTRPGPVILRDTAFTRLWHKQDNVFLLPKASINIAISNPIAKLECASLQHHMSMFKSLFHKEMKQCSYEASQAGLEFYLSCLPEVASMRLKVHGFSDKQEVLLQKVMHTLVNFSVDTTLFDDIKQCHIEGMELLETWPPSSQAAVLTTMVLSDKIIDGTQEGMESVTVESLTEFIEFFFSKVTIEMLVTGNVTEEQALQLADVVEGHLCMDTKPSVKNSELTFPQEVKLPTRCDYIYQHHHEICDTSAISVYYQCFAKSTHYNMLLQVFHQIIKEPCFGILRTQQQLGYKVCCKTMSIAPGVQGLSIQIQSDHKHPEYLDGKIQDFLQEMGSYVADMSEDAFQHLINSFVSQRLQNEKNRERPHSRYWAEIVYKQYNFDRNVAETEYLRTLTKDDITNFYNKHIAAEAPERRKLAVYIIGKDLPLADVRHKACHEIADLDELKQSLEFYPLPEPDMSLLQAAQAVKHTCSEGELSEDSKLTEWVKICEEQQMKNKKRNEKKKRNKLKKRTRKMHAKYGGAQPKTTDNVQHHPIIQHVPVTLRQKEVMFLAALLSQFVSLWTLLQ